jgi:hypothetical protein
MEQLEDVIDRLRKFDEQRREAARFREDGSGILLQSFSHPSANADRWPPHDDEQILEKAEVLKALLASPSTQSTAEVNTLTHALEKVGRDQALRDLPDHVPVLRAAKALCALAASPNSAFSESVMYFMYTIVREIFVVGPPGWSVGGAGAGDDLSPNGFVTWQCVRAVTDFQCALHQTAKLIREIETLVTSSETYRHAYAGGAADEMPRETDPWQWVDEQRLVLSFTTSVQLLRANIALKLDSLAELDKGGKEAVVSFIRAVRNDLKKDIHTHHKEFKAAEEQVNAHREAEHAYESVDPAVRYRIRWSGTAHTIAHQTVKDAVAYAARAHAALEGSPDPKELGILAKEFTKAAEHFDALLRAINAHVSRSLDTQLAAAALSGARLQWDPGEMAFAAAAYVETSPVDERVRRAAGHLLDIMGESGVFPLGSPVRTTRHQYTLHAQNAEVIRALAVILEKADTVRFDPVHAERMLAYLSGGAMLSGWISGMEHVGPRSRRVTAAAVLALARVNRMLDERINTEVFRFFSVKRVKEIRIPPLRDLFYPDYGLVYVSRPPADEPTPGGSEVATGDAAPAAHSPKVRDWKKLEKEMRETHGIYRRQSVAVVLERMRAHVCHAPVKSADETFSLVLHGPPGTGKTTLVESLAKTCGVPLVEVTPSDIILAGAERMEARARAVFEALSLLTRAVILFDEFDPVIARRVPEDLSPSVFSFLTPGMLPKLKKLHDRAEARSVAYVLVTNLIGKLDEAAIREGRFDLRMGIYPPDVLSRYGRLREVAQRYAREQTPPKEQPSDDRIRAIVRESWSGSMTTMGKPGWFSAARGDHDLRPGNAFGYIFDKSVADVPEPPREARLHLPVLPRDPEKRLKKCRRDKEEEVPPNRCCDEAEAGEEDHATREYMEWAWVVCWDHKLANSGAAPTEEGSAPGASGKPVPDKEEGPIVPGIPARAPSPTDLKKCFCEALKALWNPPTPAELD